MSEQIDLDFASDDDAKAEIGAAVRYLLKDAIGSGRGDVVREVVELVRNVGSGTLAPEHPTEVRAAKQPRMSGITYKDYVIDTYRRDVDRWRATIRRLDGKKIRVAVPHSVVGETTTSADALTAEKAVGLAKKEIDSGGLI